jgi:hypothetical protein
MSAMSAANLILSYSQHMPMWFTIGLGAAFVVLRRSTLLWLVVVIGLITKSKEQRAFCERAMTRLSYRPRLPGRRPLSL